jgi:glycosyltransferase involved in cell wall biosynthesis
VRVLYLNPFSREVSGADESLLTLLAIVIPLGVEAHVVLPAPGPPVPRYEALGATVHIVPLAVVHRGLSVSTALFPAHLARGVAMVARLARKLRIDLIHSNMEVVLEGGLAARLLRIPHVMHYRGNTMDEPKVVFDILAKLWTATADYIYCISKGTAKIFRNRGYEQNVEVMYDSIDLQAYRDAVALPEVRASLGARADDILVGTVGRVHPRKDMETFIRAAAVVGVEIPNVRFVIVGPAEVEVEHAYFSRLIELVRHLGLQDRIALVGGRRDIPEVMRVLDVFVLSSRHEGFGRVVAEAMAAGRPVVVSNEGAPPELIGDGQYGLAATPGDVNDFARQILTLLRDRPRAEAMGAAGAVAAERFSLESVGNKVWKRYCALLDSRAGQAKAS